LVVHFGSLRSRCSSRYELNQVSRYRTASRALSHWLGEVPARLRAQATRSKEGPCSCRSPFRLSLTNVLSQTVRQSFPHRPWHMNSFVRPPIGPPHSGQTQFRIADMYPAPTCVAAALVNCIRSPRNNKKPCRRSESMGGNRSLCSKGARMVALQC